MRLAAYLLLAALTITAVASPADAAVRTKLNRGDGVRFTLDRKQLSLRIVDSPRHVRRPTIRSELFGKRLVIACGSSFRSSRGKTVSKKVHWPDGALSVSYRFKRDVSRRAKWCLIEEATGKYRGVDVAFVSFLRSEQRRLLATGRGPSGGWWRLSAWRNAQLEPCLALWSTDDHIGTCFADDAEVEAKLSVTILDSSCPGDTFVLGATARAATAVTVTSRDGTKSTATLYPRPRGSRVLAQYFLAVLPGAAAVRHVEAHDAAGRLIGRDRQPALRLSGACGALIPD